MRTIGFYKKATLKRSLSLLLLLSSVHLTSLDIAAAEDAATGEGKHVHTAEANGLTRTEQNVPIPQTPADRQIAARLKRILLATGRYPDIDISSREGVVTLRGHVSDVAQAKWAEDLSRSTTGVVAVLNDLETRKARWLDLTPARTETESLARKIMAFLPYLVTSLLILAVFLFLARLNAALGRRVAGRRLNNPLLIEIVSKLFALPVMLLGLYLVLRVCGLTGIAVTVLGGTGAIGLVAGFAMKNILENYFAGVLLSIRNPYTVGDVIEVAGKLGIVQELTTRGTILADFDGNHIIIPNSTIYQNVITNLSANQTLRLHFQLGIGYSDSIHEARERILGVLRGARAVLQSPEPLVLVEDFASGSVMFGVYFWIEPKKVNGGVVKSEIMETVKTDLEQRGFTLARDVRLVAFAPGTEPAQLASTAEGSAGDADHARMHS